MIYKITNYTDGTYKNISMLENIENEEVLFFGSCNVKFEDGDQFVQFKFDDKFKSIEHCFDEFQQQIEYQLINNKNNSEK